MAYRNWRCQRVSAVAVPRGIWKPVITSNMDQDQLHTLLRKVSGLKIPASLAPVIAIVGLSNLAASLARQWQGLESEGPSFPVRCLWTFILIAVWILIISWWFRYIKWPRLWAVPLVLLVLCPLTWYLAQRVRVGIDAIILFAVQSPIIISLWSRRRPKNGAPRR
jgi:hypothetical protein